MTPVGVIGTGTMGKPMARNLLKAGIPLYVYARHPEKVRELEAEGANRVASPAELGRVCRWILLSLPFDPEVEEVVTGEKGILFGASPGSIILDTTTGSPESARKVWIAAQKKGVGYLDAPVSGGYQGALESRLTFMAGGEKEHFQKIRPLMEKLGHNLYHVGATGAGRVLKALNQIIAAMNTLTLCEAVVLGKKAGISPEILYEVLSKCAANSYHLQTKLPHFIIPGRFDMGHRIEMMIKDLEIALQMGKGQKVPLLFSSLGTELYRAGASAGYANLDISAMTKFFGSFSGVHFPDDQG